MAPTSWHLPYACEEPFALETASWHPFRMPSRVAHSTRRIVESGGSATIAANGISWGRRRRGVALPELEVRFAAAFFKTPG